ncbi:hypothetical protein BH11PSE14_BH11PSE14_08950 [soil metagenome]
MRHTTRTSTTFTRAFALRGCALIGMALVASACSKPGAGSQNLADDLAERTYGPGVQPNAAVTYQPDVIAVGGGAKSIRSASADGLVWIIDGHAAHAQDLRPGKIMLATSRAAGRVMKIAPHGEDLAVTLGPMQLGDVLRDADITLDQPFDLAKLTVQAIPALPYMYRDFATPAGTAPPPVQIGFMQPEAGEQAGDYLIQLMPIQVASAAATPMDKLPAAGKSMGKVAVGDWEMELAAKTDNPVNGTSSGKLKQRIALKIQRKLSGPGSTGLKAGIEVVVHVSDLRFKTHTVYHDGQIDQESSSIFLEGIDGVDVDISTGIAQAVGDNKKIRIEIPLEFAEPCPAYGVPLMCQVKFKFLIETALGGKNATLSASSRFNMNGALGGQGGKVITPTATEKGSIVDSIKGVSLGVSGLVFTFETRFMTGVGVPAFFTGPYAKFIAATGVTHASSLNMGLMQDCHATTVKFDAGVGWGFQIPLPQVTVLKSLLKGGKFESEAYELSQTFYNNDSFSPDVPACHF